MKVQFHILKSLFKILSSYFIFFIPFYSWAFDPSGEIKASANPCSIEAGMLYCKNFSISWTSRGTSSPCLFVRSTNQKVACATNGSLLIPWMTAEGYTFELHQSEDINSKILSSLKVHGIESTEQNENAKSSTVTGLIKAQNNPCQLSAGKTICTSEISWESTGMAMPCLFIRPTEKLFACGVTGSVSTPWITEEGFSFEMHESNDINSKLVNSLKVYGEISKTAKKQYGVGVSIPDLLINFLKPSYRSSEENKTRYKMAKKAIADAYYAGASHINVFAVGYFPSSPLFLTAAEKRNDLELWQNNPSAYWARFDEMMNEISKFNMGIVLRGWNDSAIFPVLAGETNRDLIVNPESKSYKMYIKYWTEVLKRYKNNSNFFLVGAINELNLQADIDSVAYCKSVNVNNADTACKSTGNFTTDEMIQFYYNVVKEFKLVNPNMLISSNYGAPRQEAQHLRQSKGTSWDLDSKEDFLKVITDIHAPFDVFDVHIYNGVTSRKTLDHQRFGLDAQNNYGTSFFKLINDTATNLGKSFFPLEYGDIYDGGKDSRQFSKNISSAIATEEAMGGSIWCYSFYQFDTVSFQKVENLEMNFEQGSHDDVSLVMRDVNRSLNVPSMNSSLNDNIPPLVVISFPFNASSVGPNFEAHATAADNSGRVARVEFLIDQKVLSTVDSWPFKASVSTENLAKGGHQFSVKAHDKNGNVGEDSIAINVN